MVNKIEGQRPSAREYWIKTALGVAGLTAATGLLINAIILKDLTLAGLGAAAIVGSSNLLTSRPPFGKASRG